MIEFSRYDASEFLDSEEVITEYLSAAIERNDPEAFITALGKVAKARAWPRLLRIRAPDAKASTSRLDWARSGDTKQCKKWLWGRFFGQIDASLSLDAIMLRVPQRPEMASGDRLQTGSCG